MGDWRPLGPRSSALPLSLRPSGPARQRHHIRCAGRSVTLALAAQWISGFFFRCCLEKRQPQAAVWEHPGQRAAFRAGLEIEAAGLVLIGHGDAGDIAGELFKPCVNAQYFRTGANWSGWRSRVARSVEAFGGEFGRIGAVDDVARTGLSLPPPVPASCRRGPRRGSRGRAFSVSGLVRGSLRLRRIVSPRPRGLSVPHARTFPLRFPPTIPRCQWVACAGSQVL